MTELDKNLKRLLNSHPSLQISDDQKKIKCSLTGHEMPCRAEAVEEHVRGKRFQRLAAAIKPKLEPSVYSEFLVPSNKPKHEKQLFCKLTFRHLNNVPQNIALHVNGKRFQKAYEKWKQCQETGEVFKALEGRSRPRARDDEADTEGERSKKRKKKGGRALEDDDEIGDGNIDIENSDDEDDNDSLSDLYPVDYFEKLEISAATYNPFTLNGGATAAASSSSKQGSKSSGLKRKMQNKKKPTTLKTVKAKKSKS